MPTRSRERRGPFCLQGRRTDGLPDGSPQEEGEAGQVLGGVRNFTPKRQPLVSRDPCEAATWTGIARGHQHLEVVMPFRPVEGDPQPSARPQEPEPFIDPRVPQEPIEPIQGTAPLNPQPGGATRPGPPRPRPQSPGLRSSAGSGERGLTNSSTWGIVPYGVSYHGAHGFHLRRGWGSNSHRRRPVCPLPTPKVISGQEALAEVSSVRCGARDPQRRRLPFTASAGRDVAGTAGAGKVPLVPAPFPPAAASGPRRPSH
jgi:hypothetical protein